MLWREFRDFLLQKNALALALGVVIGGAVNRVVGGIVDNVIMPVVGVVLPGGAWREAQFALTPDNAIKYGDMIGRLVDFTLIALVVFLLTRMLVRQEKPPPAPPTRTCPECLEKVPLEAKRCRACTSVLPVAEAA